MAKLLKEGATMLDKTCPKCGTLIYRLPDKKIICPSCGSEIIIQKDTPKNNVQISSQQESTSIYNFVPLMETICSKIDQYRKILHDESDIEKIEKIVIMIDNLIRLYKKVKNINLPIDIE